MYIIGLTGGTGSGKTIALHAFEKQGSLALDCDVIYHDLLQNNDVMKSKIETGFPGILINNIIDRKKLGDIVFNDKTALQKLNNITHAFVIDEVKHRLACWEKQGGVVAAMDAIALFESGANKICDITIGIIAPVEIRIKRIMKRDGITKEQAKLRIDAQKPDSFYNENCDVILINNFETSGEFEAECIEWYTNNPATG